jgi:predicted transcriptional regulator
MADNGKMNEMHEDIKEIRSDVKELIVRQAEHNVILKQHEQRSTSLEQQVALKEKELMGKLAPIEKHVQLVDASLKIAGVAASLLATAYVILQILRFFSLI